jgi:hypothetical protein
LATAKANKEKSVRTCVSCGIEYPLTPKNFYFDAKKNYFEPRCIPCRREVSNQWRRDKKDETYEWTDNVVLDGVGEYTSEEQKRATAELLIALGWKYSNEKQLWYKPSIKSIHNHWKFQKYERSKGQKETESI